MSNTARLLAIIERQFKEIDLARKDTLAAHARELATLTERNTKLELDFKELGKYLSQAQDRVGVLEKQLKKQVE